MGGGGRLLHNQWLLLFEIWFDKTLRSWQLAISVSNNLEFVYLPAILSSSLLEELRTVG